MIQQTPLPLPSLRNVQYYESWISNFLSVIYDFAHSWSGWIVQFGSWVRTMPSLYFLGVTASEITQNYSAGFRSCENRNILLDQQRNKFDMTFTIGITWVTLLSCLLLSCVWCTFGTTRGTIHDATGRDWAKKYDKGGDLNCTLGRWSCATSGAICSWAPGRGRQNTTLIQKYEQEIGLGPGRQLEEMVPVFGEVPGQASVLANATTLLHGSHQVYMWHLNSPEGLARLAESNNMEDWWLTSGWQRELNGSLLLLNSCWERALIHNSWTASDQHGNMHQISV